MTPEQRFERIETLLERITMAHLELETAQVNQQVAYTRFVVGTDERLARTQEKIDNLTILVDRLIERDME